MQHDRIVGVISKHTWIPRKAVRELLEAQAEIAEHRGKPLAFEDQEQAASQARAEVHELCHVGRRPFAPVVTVLIAAVAYRNLIGLFDDETANAYVAALLDAVLVCQAVSGRSVYVPAHAMGEA